VKTNFITGTDKVLNILRMFEPILELDKNFGSSKTAGFYRSTAKNIYIIPTGIIYSCISSNKPDICLFSVSGIWPEIRQVISGIRPDTGYQKSPDVSPGYPAGRISGASLAKNYTNWLKRFSCVQDTRTEGQLRM
jgi:hypothetical protein